MWVVLHRDSWSKKISEGVYDGVKTFPCSDLKVETSEGGAIFISGYVNNKNIPDAYGDIPTSIDGKNVYDLGRYNLNPVLLIDHECETASIAGKAVEIREDEIGLFVKFQLMLNPKSEDVAHAIQAVIEGLLKAFSIGGRWYFDDEQNRALLTRAYIHEISLVAIGADQYALISEVASKSDESQETKAVDGLELAVERYMSGDISALYEIKKIKEEVFS